jgi:hypothetical protein
MIAYSQELVIQSLRKQELTQSMHLDTILDMNDEPCAVIEVLSDIERMDFFSNRGIEKVERSENAYWVWVPQGTTSFKIGVPNFPLLELDLPEAAKITNLFIIELKPIYPQKIIYKDTLAPVFSFQSIPDGAKLYINDAYQGETPIQVNIPFDSFRFTMKRKRYADTTGIVLQSENMKSFTLKLEHDPHGKRFFGLATLGMNFSYTPTIGITVGQIGRTGWYVSHTFSYNYYLVKKYENSPLSVIDNSIINYNYTPGFYYTIPNNAKVHDVHSRFSIGISQQVFNQGFISFGIGRTTSNKIILLEKHSYITNEVVSKEFGKLSDFSFGYDVTLLDFEAGFIYRIKDHIILAFSSTLVMAEDYSPYRKLYFLNGSLGLGYNF